MDLPELLDAAMSPPGSTALEALNRRPAAQNISPEEHDAIADAGGDPAATASDGTSQPRIRLPSGKLIPLLRLVASIGNVLGSTVNWWLGREVARVGIARFGGRRWFPVKPETYAKVERWYARYGVWSLLFAWLPIGGDPLTADPATLPALEVRSTWVDGTPVYQD